jgi:hypothetical protein
MHYNPISSLIQYHNYRGTISKVSRPDSIIYHIIQLIGAQIHPSNLLNLKPYMQFKYHIFSLFQFIISYFSTMSLFQFIKFRSRLNHIFHLTFQDLILSFQYLSNLRSYIPTNKFCVQVNWGNIPSSNLSNVEHLSGSNIIVFQT